MAAPGVSSLATNRVNWVSHPQGTSLPAIVLTTVSDGEPITLGGMTGLMQSRFQVDCYADAYKDASDLATSVRAHLSGYRAGGFRLIEYVTTRDGREGGTNEADRPFRVSMDFLAHWRQS
jgi:hypothetical protein